MDLRGLTPPEVDRGAVRTILLVDLRGLTPPEVSWEVARSTDFRPIFRRTGAGCSSLTGPAAFAVRVPPTSVAKWLTLRANLVPRP